MSGAAFDLRRVVLVAITDLARVPPALSLDRAARMASAAEPGTVAFQLRDRDLGARELLAFGARLRDVARAGQQGFVVNDRLDLALLLDADAVHLGEQSVESSAARRLLGHLPICRACHDPERVTDLDADLVVLSPILESRKGRPPLGLSVLADVRARLDRAQTGQRLFALGGVDAGSARACLEAGAHGVAAIGAAFAEPSPEPLLAALAIAR